MVRKGHCEELGALFSEHEEANAPLLLPHNRPLTDIEKSLSSHQTQTGMVYDNLQCTELWFRTGL